MFVPVMQQLFAGFGETIKVFILTLVFSIPLGLVVCFGSMNKWRPFRRLAGGRLGFLGRWMPIRMVTRTFVWIIRGSPLMLQLLIFFYGPGLLFGLPAMPRFTATIVAFSINYACYFSEIYRGGIESIPKGQYEAGYVLGLTKQQIFRKIILKQVIKNIVPPMSNEIITLIKDTALANCIIVCEIIKQAKELAATKALVWPLFYTGVFYLLFVGILTIVLGKFEKKLSYFRS
jgi:polar amino acid transport system permease protein